MKGRFSEHVPDLPAPMGWRIPFTIAFPPAVATTHGALIYRNGPNELVEFGFDGRLTRIFRRVLKTMPLPEVLLAFAALVRDWHGDVWAGVYDPEREVSNHWIVFDDTGRARGTVTTPDGLEVHAVTATAIYGVWTGTLGVQEVRRYPLTRR